MSRQSPLLKTVLCMWLAVATGCTPQQPFYLFEDGDLSHYKGMATDLEVPDVDLQSLAEVDGASPPLTLTNPEAREIWELTLEEAVQTALANSKVMRSIGASLATPETITRSPDAMPTIYDPARIESNPRYGTEAALSAFDTQFTTSVFWEKVDKPNNVFTENLYYPRVSRGDMGSFNAELSKYNATGGQSSLSYNAYYDLNNSQIRMFPSDWNVDVTAEFRQPLLQGAGVQFNRIAGPGAIPGYNNGVIIARLRTDIALTDFESAVRTLVSDVERAYWDLYLAYRELDAVIAGRDSALQTWRKIYSLYELGARGGEAEKEAQAREQYFLFRAQVEQRLSALYTAESQLRYMMGLAATDGRLIRPAEEPTTAKVAFDWVETQSEALARNVDLRRQRWRVKEKEMEMIAAKNYLLPRLDAVGQYSWLGWGNDLWNANRAERFDNAMQTLTDGDFQQWRFGLEMNIPIGFRKEMAGVRHAQLNLARERTIYAEEELEVSHQLANAIRDLDKGVVLIRTNFNRRIAAKKQVEAVEAAYETGTVTLDVLLDAQRRLAEAEIEYYRSLVQYNLAIVAVHFRKGSLLEYNGVYLAEGPWPGKAYFDARRRARERDAGLFLDYGFTRPKVISRGAYHQQAGGEAVFPDEIGLPVDEAMPELVPTPEPEGDQTNDTRMMPSLTGEPADAAWPHAVGARRGQLASGAKDTAVGLSNLLSASSDAGRASDAKKVSYEEPVDDAQSASSSEKLQKSKSQKSWKSVDSLSKSHESLANPTPAQAPRSASGWKGI